MLLLHLEELVYSGQGPLLLQHISIGLYPAAPPEDLPILELPFEDGPVDEEQLAPSMHITILHFSLVPDPGVVLAEVGRSVENSPTIGLVVGELPLIFHLAVGEVELSLSMHHIIFPAALVVAVIFEDVFAFPVF